MISYANLINDLLSQVDTLLVDYVQNGYETLADYLAAPLGAAIVLFFVCYGVSISQGWIKGSVAGLTHSLFKIGVIYFLAMNWGNFSFYVYDLFYKGASEIGAVLLKASPIHFSTSEDLTINSALQTVLSEIWEIAQWIFDKGGITDPGPWLGGVLVGLIGFILVGFALLEIVIAKCMLSILFVIAPLFIAFTLFETTETFFDRWLGACVSYSTLMILISASLGVVLSIDYWIVNDMHAVEAKEVTWIDTGAVILVTWVCIGIIKRISLLALSIGGTVSTISGEEMFAGSVGALLNPSRESNNSPNSRGGTKSSSGNNRQSRSSSEGRSHTGSSAINPAINDRSRFVDGRSDNHAGEQHHSSRSNYPTQSENSVKPDYSTKPNNYTSSDRGRFDSQSKNNLRRLHSHSVSKAKNKNEFEDYN